jgi:L-amino acid N-acyltransferase
MFVGPATMHAMLLRLATEADLPAINDIYNHYVLTSTTTYQEVPDTLDDRRAWFRNREPRHVVTVAEVDGQVVGWASLNVFRARSAYRFSCENSVYVDHRFFRRGLGGALLADSIERAKVAGFRTIVAGIDADQAASIALHARQGFEAVGRFTRVGFKFGRWLDVVFMQLMLES